MVDASQAPFLDDLAYQADRWHEAVVEAAQVDNTSRLGRLPHLARFVGVHAERLLAEDVLARLNSGHRRLEMQDIGRTVVEDLDRRILDDGAPVGDAFRVA